jgi:hypothetical protein
VNRRNAEGGGRAKSGLESNEPADDAAKAPSPVCGAADNRPGRRRGLPVEAGRRAGPPPIGRPGPAVAAAREARNAGGLRLKESAADAENP